MNKILLSMAVAAALLATACSDIDSDERYLAVDKVEAKRCVLLEDFTGQECLNCPAAHEVIDKLLEQYGDDLIPVSIHAGSFAIPATDPYDTGLMQPEGNTYNDMWGIQEWPKGVVNRRSGAVNHDAWADAVRTELSRPTTLDLDLEATYSADTDAIAITTTLSPSADITGKLQLWVLEDGIIAIQKNGRVYIDDYCHNHVYRASVNGVGGEDVTLKANIHTSCDHSIAVRHTDTEDWTVGNLSIVAFVYDDSGVVQAAKAQVAPQP